VEILAAAASLRDVEHLDLTNNPTRDPVDAAAGAGWDEMGRIVPESIWLPDFGRELEARHGKIKWLHALDHFLEGHPPNRYRF
jgi:hypothetical protein